MVDDDSGDELIREDEEGSEQISDSDELVTEDDDESDDQEMDSDVSESFETSDHDGATELNRWEKMAIHVKW
jgi:hypothetical protein